MELKKFACKCGYMLEPKPDGKYYCGNCNTTWREEALEEMLLRNRNKLVETLGEALATAREEEVVQLRKNLYTEIHKKYIDSKRVIGICRQIKDKWGEDFQADFYELASKDNSAEINRFLDTVDVDKVRKLRCGYFRLSLKTVPKRLYAVAYVLYGKGVQCGSNRHRKV